MIIKNMQKLPEAPDRKRATHAQKKKEKKREPSRQKKESLTLSAVTSRVTIHKFVLLLVEGAMRRL